MRHFSWIAFSFFMLAVTNQAGADPAGAILRCDPATLIKQIDGDAHRGYFASWGSGFKECAIPLSPGNHTVKVCFDASAGIDAMDSLSGSCGHDLDVTVNAQPGHTYRVKLLFGDDWKTWIEDVTESEASLSYEEPPEKPKPTGSKKDLETILVMRATPEYGVLGLQKGVIRGKWFNVGRFGALKLLNFSRKGAPDGYNLYRAYGGDTFAFTSGQLMTGAILHLKMLTPCGEFPVRVYEDIPPGKVLYVGHLTVKEAPPYGYVGSYSDELAEARAYIDAHHPELAGRLEAAPYREALTANMCYGLGGDLYVPSATMPTPRIP